MEYSVVPKGFDPQDEVRPTDYYYEVNSSEPAKTVINASLSVKEMLIHFLAISSTLTVIILNAIEQYWVDLGKDSWLSIGAQIKYLQFAAKLHEIVMMASVTYFLMFYLHNLLLKSGIPFGLLDAPYTIGAGGGVSLLLEGRFWRPWTHNRIIGIILLVSIVLTVGLAPSSAIAMIPSLAYWPVKNPYGQENSKVYFSIPMQLPGHDRLPSPWPTLQPKNGWPIRDTRYSCFSENATEQFDCPAGGWEQISQWLVGKLAVGSSANLTMNELYTNSQRLILTQSLEAKDKSSNRQVNRRISSTPTSLVTGSTAGFWAYLQNSRVGEISTVKVPQLVSTEQSAAYQPIVYSQCKSEVYDINDTGPSNLTFEMVQAPWDDNYDADDLYIDSNTTLLLNLPSRQPRFGWYSADELSTISVSIIPIETSNDKKSNFQSSLIIACSFDARWASSKIFFTPHSSSLVNSNITDLGIFEEEYIQKHYDGDKDLFKGALNVSGLVSIPSGWLEGFNFNMTDKEGNATTSMIDIFNSFIEGTPYNNTHFQISDLDKPYSVSSDKFEEYQSRVADTLSTIQSVLIADGMARFASLLWRPYLEVRSGDSKDFKYINLLFSNMTSELDDADSVFKNATKEDAFSIDFDAYRYGYGYGFRSDDTGTSIKLAISFLGVYLLAATVYVFTIIWLRFQGRYMRSQCWQTMQNLVALAKNSDHSMHLTGTGAGIQSPETWKLNVKVRVVENESLNLAFMKKSEEVGEVPGIEKKYY